jgi:hypothetical protein
VKLNALFVTASSRYLAEAISQHISPDYYCARFSGEQDAVTGSFRYCNLTLLYRPYRADGCGRKIKHGGP